MSWLDAVRHRLVSRWRGHRDDQELADEIAYHLELEAARQRRDGLPTPAAKIRALARFGNPVTVIQATRDARGHVTGASLMQDLHWAWRSLARRPGFTLLSIITLALGVATTVTAFTVLNTVLLRPLPYDNPDRLVFLQDQTGTRGTSPSSFPNFLDWRTQARTFGGLAAFAFPSTRTVKAGDEPLRVRVAEVSGRFFGVLGVPLAVGREFTDDENRPGGPAAAVVTNAFWHASMGARTALGTVEINGAPVPVVGVLPASFHFAPGADLYLAAERSPGTCRNCANYLVVGRLGTGVTRESAAADLNRIVTSQIATYGHDMGTRALAVISLRDYVVSDYRLMLEVVFGAAALVLLVACVNLISAQLARGLTRTREVAMRSALGASYGRLVRQLMVESALLAATGTAIGAGLSVVAVRVVRTVGAGQLPRLDELQVDRRALGFVVLLAAAVALLIGLFPALRLSAATPGQLLRGGRGTVQSIRRSVWRALITAEVALTVVLGIGAVLLVRTLHNIVSADTGFDPRSVITVSLPVTGSMTPADIERASAAMAGVPGVQGLGWTSRLPLEWGNGSAPVRRPGDPIDHDWRARAGFRLVSPEYFGVLRQPIVQGRAFASGDIAGAPPVAMITPGIARALWPGENPIGKEIATNYLGDHWLTVVGVVAEASSWEMARGGQNEIYVPLRQQMDAIETDLVAVIRTSKDPRAVVPALRATLHATLPDVPTQFDTMTDRIVRSAADRRFAMVALAAFSAIALLLAAIGVYGTMSYLTMARTREVGVRLALGAPPTAVLRHVLAEAAGLVGSGIVVGCLAGALATRYLQATLYGVTRGDPVAYLGTAGILLITALVGALVPGWQASRTDPVVAMRAD